jgi:hypothetical protein
VARVGDIVDPAPEHSSPAPRDSQACDTGDTRSSSPIPTIGLASYMARDALQYLVQRIPDTAVRS